MYIRHHIDFFNKYRGIFHSYLETPEVYLDEDTFVKLGNYNEVYFLKRRGLRSSNTYRMMERIFSSKIRYPHRVSAQVGHEIFIMSKRREIIFYVHYGVICDHRLKPIVSYQNNILYIDKDYVFPAPFKRVISTLIKLCKNVRFVDSKTLIGFYSKPLPLKKFKSISEMREECLRIGVLFNMSKNSNKSLQLL